MASIDIDALLRRHAIEFPTIQVVPGVGVEGHFAGAQADLADAVYITSNLWRCKKANRVNDCFGAAYLQISECLHGNPTYKVEDTTAKGTHTIECQWYNIDGRKLNEKPTTKGVYISRGKKVVIR